MFDRMSQTMRDAALDLRGRIRPYADVGEVRIPLDARLSAAMRRRILGGRYETSELRIVNCTLREDDRVLECGAGVGLLSALAAKRVGSYRVKTFEANPQMAEIIHRTYTLNNVSPELVLGAIGPREGQLEFHVRENFYASSSHAKRADGALRTVTVPMYALHSEIVAHRPTFLLIDIEGGEEELVSCSDLPGVHKIMTEVHPDLIGADGVRRFVQWLLALGFVLQDRLSTPTELFLERRLAHGKGFPQQSI